MTITDIPRPGAARYRRTGGGCGGQGWAAGRLELQEPALQHFLFTRQRGDSSQVFPDFNKFRGMVLFFFWWFFQLTERKAEV